MTDFGQKITNEAYNAYYTSSPNAPVTNNLYDNRNSPENEELYEILQNTVISHSKLK